MADSTSSSSDNAQRPQQQQQQQNSQSGGLQSAILLMSTKKTDTVLLSIRLLVLVLTFFYLIPFSPFSAANIYQKVLLANAAISALRLHQRLPPFRFTREYLSIVLIEDSAHYLLYSMIFLPNRPITLVLLPIVLFALLHSSSFMLAILNAMGSRGALGNLIASFVEQYQREIFLTISLTEVSLMPTLIFAIMAGLASIFSPFMYYQFLILRYSSRRNPYTRQAFHWLRVSMEKFATSPRCPVFARNLIHKSIEIICRLAPPVVA